MNDQPPSDQRPPDQPPFEGAPSEQPPAGPPPYYPPPPSGAPPLAWAPPPFPEDFGPTRRRPLGVLVVAGALAAVLAVGSGVGIGWGLAQTLGSAHTERQGLALTVPGRSSSSDSVAARVEPAIVDINTTVQSGQRTGQAAGTGMILTSAGQVLTNHHVVQGATSISVTVPGHGSPYKATVVGVDTAHDVALLQIQGASHLPTVSLATSAPTVGESVVAIGNAYGQGGAPSVTQGTITALDQQITATDGAGSSEQLSGLIESDASIAPGDSGGALVDLSGHVLGMITAGDSGRFEQASNNGYEVPITQAKSSVAQIRAGDAGPTIIIGQAGYIGVQVQDLDQQSAAQLGLGVDSGALVIGVVSGSPAAGAGIGANSVITEVDGQTVDSTATLGSLLHVHKPGETVRVTWIDQDGTHTASLTLTSGPQV